MSRFILAVFAGLIGAAILHLAIIFMLPWLSENSSAAYIQTIAAPFETVVLKNDVSTEQHNPHMDPLFETALCRYDLSEGAARFSASGHPLYWSLSVYDVSGTVFFSANDRIADSTNVDLVIANKQQLRFVRENTPDEISQAIIAPTDSDMGFVLLRVFSPDASWKPVVDDYLSTIQCQAIDIQR
ncbi:DUF1254 domain-containing protein [Ahrensia sp. 13_GOM-1096m]|uniref:DUF1254 domain-containing protein n=1 Tax=Ahrensia sp. 13_GOM-1096m TaxID=1380380 RepID=UPI000478F410|nr:DUF1254 domain-containing protein [Ahrensia sp. 13_GOM-1096m]